MEKPSTTIGSSSSNSSSSHNQLNVDSKEESPTEYREHDHHMKKGYVASNDKDTSNSNSIDGSYDRGTNHVHTIPTTTTTTTIPPPPLPTMNMNIKHGTTTASDDKSSSSCSSSSSSSSSSGSSSDNKHPAPTISVDYGPLPFDVPGKAKLSYPAIMIFISAYIYHHHEIDKLSFIINIVLVNYLSSFLLSS